MKWHFLLNALRSLRRHKLQSLINIASLAVGLAVFAFAFLYARYQLSYNKGWPDAERIHRLTIETRGIPGTPDRKFNSVRAVAWPQITARFADEIEAASRQYRYALFIKDAANPGITLDFVDPAFSAIFPLEVVAGDLDP